MATNRMTVKTGGASALRLMAALLFAGTVLCACMQTGSGPATGASAQTVAAAKRPNVLYILADDLGYADLGVFGSEIPTPNLDELAKSGMLLTNFYASMTCSPTRAMVMSGMDHHLAGLGVMGARTSAAGTGAARSRRSTGMTTRS